MHSVVKSWLLLTGFVVFYIIYLLFGALAFSTIERPEEDRLRHEMETLKQEFLNQSCTSAASLELFLLKVLRAHKSGMSVLLNASRQSNWDLTSSMFFANTLVTTVGKFTPAHFDLALMRQTCAASVGCVLETTAGLGLVQTGHVTEAAHEAQDRSRVR